MCIIKWYYITSESEYKESYIVIIISSTNNADFVYMNISPLFFIKLYNVWGVIDGIIDGVIDDVIDTG